MLRIALGTGAALGAGTLLGLRPAFAGHIEYDTRAAFDQFLREFESSDQLGQATDPNDNQGALAWGQSYVLQGLVLAYQAFRDTRYLDHLVDNIDAVLDTRDSARGVADYRGLSLPAWRSGYPYTAGAVELADAAGRPVLQVRTVKTPIEQRISSKPLEVEPLIDVEVVAGAEGSFTLVVAHRGVNKTERHENLSMDPASPSYAVRRLHDAWPTDLLLTAKDLRADPAAGPAPAAGTYQMASQQGIFAVHTGMITSPIASFARLVHETPALRARYAATGRRYVEACEAAIAVHDREWGQNDKGEGWYQSARGMPVPYADGAEQPANQFLAPARTILQLAAITRDPLYRDRARRMARTFKNELTLDAGGAYTWHYWPSWGRIYNGWSKADDVSEYRLSYSGARQIEDTSHGHIDVDFAVRAFWDHVVFDEKDMARFARTFTRNVAARTADGGATVWSNVDATGVTGNRAFETISAAWMALAVFDRKIFEHVDETFQRIEVDPATDRFGSNVLDVANLAWFGAPGDHRLVGPMPPRPDSSPEGDR
ncbi:MAG: hypothetical protein ACRDTU_06090 [Micromonosporaceae bacterium]